MINKFICNHLFNSICIDTDKNVRPCCAYKGNWGFLDQSLMDFHVHPQRIADQQAAINGEWPKGCEGCKIRESHVGNSMRTHIPFEYVENQKIKYIEWNSSNICNLACATCWPEYSSQWTDIYNARNKNSFKNHVPNLQLSSYFFETLDLSELEFIVFKGGEPFLSKDTLNILKYFREIGILNRIKIVVTTNATCDNPEFLELIGEAKSSVFILSIDAYPELNQWIRWAPGNYELPTEETYLQTIKKLAEVKSINRIDVNTTISSYNIFKLEECDMWYKTFKSRVNEFYSGLQKNMLFEFFDYSNTGVSILSDPTRLELIDKYCNIDPVKYAGIIKMLKEPWLGREKHNNWVNNTKWNDTMKPMSILKIVPELEKELVYM